MARVMDKSKKKATLFVKRKSKRPCFVCANKIEYVDYKDTGLLKRFQNDRSKILPRKQTHLCAQHQRDITVAIKRAREIALLPFSSK